MTVQPWTCSRPLRPPLISSGCLAAGRVEGCWTAHVHQSWLKEKRGFSCGHRVSTSRTSLSAAGPLHLSSGQRPHSCLIVGGPASSIGRPNLEVHSYQWEHRRVHTGSGARLLRSCAEKQDDTRRPGNLVPAILILRRHVYRDGPGRREGK